MGTLGCGLSQIVKLPGCKRGPCAVMGSASTGRGEYPLPVAGLDPKRGQSLANLKAVAIEEMMAGGRPVVPRAIRRARRGPEKFGLVRLPHWPEGVAKRGG